MKWRIFSNLAALSLALALLVSGFWIFAIHHTHCWGTIVWHQSPHPGLTAHMSAYGCDESGIFYVSGDDDINFDNDPNSPFFAFETREFDHARQTFAGYGPEGFILHFSAPQPPYFNFVISSGGYQYGRAGPDFAPTVAWLVVLPCLWLLALLFHRFNARRKIQPGYCRKCGYDLRASPDRCPECGTLRREAGKFAPT